MARREKKARRLVADGTTFHWKVSHRHRGEDGRTLDCREVLAVYPAEERGGLEVTFRAGPGRLVPEAYVPSGAVGMGEGGFLNLHEPGTSRALLDEALLRGWCTDAPQVLAVDGWTLFDAVAARRNEAPGDDRSDPDGVGRSD
ncbi:hypothetical protein OG521_35360 [Streptomyces sp. NBC_01463]